MVVVGDGEEITALEIGPAVPQVLRNEGAGVMGADDNHRPFGAELVARAEVGRRGRRRAGSIDIPAPRATTRGQRDAEVGVAVGGIRGEAIGVLERKPARAAVFCRVMPCCSMWWEIDSSRPFDPTRSRRGSSSPKGVPAETLGDGGKQWDRPGRGGIAGQWPGSGRSTSPARGSPRGARAC